MKCPVKVYLFNHIHPFFNPPMEGLPTLSQAFEEFYGDTNWNKWVYEILDKDSSTIKFKDAKAFTLQVDCVIVKLWHLRKERIKKVYIYTFNSYLEDLIKAKGGYK